MSGFSTQPLPPEQAALVYPLVREAMPGVDLRTWLRFARRVGDPKRAAREGIVIVTRDARALPCGLFVYRRDDQLGQGPVLVAEHLVAVDLLDPAPATRALVAALEDLARRLGCTAIRAMVLSQSSPLAADLHGAGLRSEGQSMRKEVSAPAEGAATVRPA
jgi:hypothetical protein